MSAGSKQRKQELCDGQLNEDTMNDYVTTLPVTLTGVRPGEMILGHAARCGKAIFRVTGDMVRPVGSELNKIRAIPSLWFTFLTNMQRIPFFASLSIQERETWLETHQSSGDKLDRFVGDDSSTLLVECLDPGVCSYLMNMDQEELHQAMHPRTLEAFHGDVSVPHLHPILLFTKKSWKVYEGSLRLDTKDQKQTFLTSSSTVMCISLTTGQVSVPDVAHPCPWFPVPIKQGGCTLIMELEMDTLSIKPTMTASFLLTLVKRLPIPSAASVTEADIDTCIRAMAACTSGGLKSLIQKIIRFHPATVQLFRDSSVLVPAPLVLVVACVLEMFHPGAFVPNIQRFVSGLESFTKRLAVICMEDSWCPPDQEHILVSLLASSKLAQTCRTWFPSTMLMVHWLEFALSVSQCTSTWNYDAKRGEAAPPVTHWMGSTPLQVASALLDELRSFSFDLGLVRDIALHAPKVVHRPLDVVLEARTMQLCEAVDFHWNTDFVFWMSPTLIESICLSARSYKPLFDRIWIESSSLNPRRMSVSSSSSSSSFLDDLRHAQWKLLETKTKTHPPPQSSSSSLSSSSSSSSFQLDFVLDPSWLSAMMGPLEVTVKWKQQTPTEDPESGSYKILVSLSTTNPYEWIVMRKPTRDVKHKGSLHPLLIEQAKLEAGRLLKTQGVPLKAARAPIPALRDQTLFLVTEEKEEDRFVLVPSHQINKKRKANTLLPSSFRTYDKIPWESLEQSTLTFTIPEEVCSSSFMTLLEEKMKQTSIGTLCRVLMYLGTYGTTVLLHRIGRDGKGVKQAISIYDVGAFHFLYYVAVTLAPGALRPRTLPGQFDVQSGPLLWAIRQRIQTFVMSSPPPPPLLSEGWKQFSWQDAKARQLFEFQRLSLQRLIESYQMQRRVQFLWQKVGSGKTLLVLMFLRYLYEQGKLPPIVVYSTIQSSFQHIEEEIKQMGLPVKVHTYSSCRNANSTTFTPFSIHLVEHDTLRLVKDQLIAHGSDIAFVLDEADKAFNETLRTSAALEMTYHAKVNLLLTGTIIVDHDLRKLIQWLEGCVPCEVNASNVYSLAHSIVSNEVQLEIQVNRHFTENEDQVFQCQVDSKEQYRALAPIHLGGLLHPSQFDAKAFALLCQFCWDLGDLWIVQHIATDEPTRPSVIVTRSVAHSQRLKTLLLSHSGLGCQDKDVYMLEGSNSISLSDPQTCPRFFIHTVRHNRGFNLTAYDRKYTGVYFTNQAVREQTDGRLVRIGQSKPKVDYYTVACGVLSLIHRNHSHVQSLSDAFEDLKKKVAW